MNRMAHVARSIFRGRAGSACRFRGRQAKPALLLLLLVVLPLPLGADSIVLAGGTVHTLVGEPALGDVVVEDGVIRAVGAGVAVPEGARRIDVTGLHVYPGIFDAMSLIGLVEVNAEAATVDTTEIGGYNPQLQAATAVHPASEVIPVARETGLTHTVTAPQAARDDGVIAGQASLVRLDGWTVEEMAIDPGIAMVIHWPAIRTRSFDFDTFSVRETPYKEAKEKAEEARNELSDWFEAARHYAQATASSSPRTERNLKLEALARVFAGLPVIIEADTKLDIEAAVAFAEKQGLRMILAGGRDAWKVKEALAEKGIPVILGSTQSLPEEDDDPYDRPFRTAGELASAGVKIAFGSSAGGGRDPGGAHSARTLPYEAAMAVAYGLPREEAMKALTLYPAEMFGVADKLGSIEEGKAANLYVADGDPLELTSEVRYLLIAGEVVSTENRQRSLYERYRAR